MTDFFWLLLQHERSLEKCIWKGDYLDDGTVFLYSIQPYEMKNMLEQVVAVLDEYSFTKKESLEGYKLYRTNDGNWYDVSDTASHQSHAVWRKLKLAIASIDKLTS